MHKYFNAALLNFHTVTHTHTFRNCLLQYRLFLLAAEQLLCSRVIQRIAAPSDTALQLDLRLWCFVELLCVVLSIRLFSPQMCPLCLNNSSKLIGLVTFCRMTFNNPQRGIVGSPCYACAGGETTTHQGFKFKVKWVMLHCALSLLKWWQNKSYIFYLLMKTAVTALHCGALRLQ